MDGYYYAFNGASTFIVYVCIFPILQKLYKRVYDAKDASKVDAFDVRAASEHSSGDNFSSATHTEVTSKNAIWNDLTFFIFGSVVYIIAYLIVPLYETEAALFLGKESFHL